MIASAPVSTVTAVSWLFANGADEVAVRIAPRLVVNSAVAVHRATLAGAGIAILSHILAAPDIEAGRLINLLPDFPPARLPITLVYPSRHNMPLRVRTVLDFLVATMRQNLLMASPPAPDSNRRRTVETALHSTKARTAAQRAAA